MRSRISPHKSSMSQAEWSLCQLTVDSVNKSEYILSLAIIWIPLDNQNCLSSPGPVDPNSLRPSDCTFQLMPQLKKAHPITPSQLVLAEWVPSLSARAARWWARQVEAGLKWIDSLGLRIKISPGRFGGVNLGIMMSTACGCGRGNWIVRNGSSDDGPELRHRQWEIRAGSLCLCLPPP